MTDRPHAATFSIPCADERRAATLADSVAVEAGAVADDRARATVRRHETTVEVTVDASDLVALRAGLNTWVRLVDAAQRAADAAAD